MIILLVYIFSNINYNFKEKYRLWNKNWFGIIYAKWSMLSMIQYNNLWWDLWYFGYFERLKIWVHMIWEITIMFILNHFWIIKTNNWKIKKRVCMLNYIILLRLPKHEISDAWVGGHAFRKNSAENALSQFTTFWGVLKSITFSISQNDRHGVVFELIIWPKASNILAIRTER